MIRHRLIAMLCVVAIFNTSCASSTVITSTPVGAQVKIDGQPVGGTPIQFTESAVWLWTKHMVTIEAPGYQPMHTQMNAQLSPLYLILGLLCLIPFLFVGEFNPTYHYVLGVAQSSTLIGTQLQEHATVNFE